MTMIILRMGMRRKSKATGAKLGDTKPVVTTEVPASDSGQMKLLHLMSIKTSAVLHEVMKMMGYSVSILDRKDQRYRDRHWST